MKKKNIDTDNLEDFERELKAQGFYVERPKTIKQALRETFQSTWLYKVSHWIAAEIMKISLKQDRRRKKK